MSVKEELFSVGWDASHQLDFGVRGDVAELSLEDMNRLRVMIVVGIGTLEDMWRREREKQWVPKQADT